MNTNEILERSKQQEPKLAEGDLIFLLDAEEEGCIREGYAVTPEGGLDDLDVNVYETDDYNQIEIERDGACVLCCEQVNNRLKELDAVDDVKIVYLNVGRRNVVVEGGPVRPGESGSFVPVSLEEALRACGYFN